MIPLLREMKRVSLGCCIKDAMLGVEDVPLTKSSVPLLVVGYVILLGRDECLLLDTRMKLSLEETHIHDDSQGYKQQTDGAPSAAIHPVACLTMPACCRNA